jgi:hypothetical protein
MVLERTSRRRVEADELKWAVGSYGRTLVPPPDEAWENLDIVTVTGSSPPTYSVVLPMYTAEEGSSDLSLDLTLREFSPGLFEVEISDLHVL